MRKKVKHSKYKNTGLIFEFLVRQLTVDVINDQDKSPSLNIIKKRFHENTELGKELSLYQALCNTKFTSDKKADFLIAETTNAHRKLNLQELKRQKYNLIKEIKDTYDIVNFLSSRVSDYKLFASAYKLFECYKEMNPEDRTEVYFNILEHVTTKKHNIK